MGSASVARSVCSWSPSDDMVLGEPGEVRGRSSQQGGEPGRVRDLRDPLLAGSPVPGRKQECRSDPQRKTERGRDRGVERHAWG